MDQFDDDTYVSRSKKPETKQISKRKQLYEPPEIRKQKNMCQGRVDLWEREQQHHLDINHNDATCIFRNPCHKHIV